MEIVQLFWSHPGGECTNTLVRRHFPRAEMEMNGKVKIVIATNIPLRMILFTISWIVGIQALDEPLKSHFQYVIYCLMPKVFNSCSGILTNMNRKLPKGKRGNLKHFGFSFIPVTSFLEHVPLFWYEWAEVPYLAP